MQLFGNVTQGLSTALDLYQARHTVLAENIANSETPDFAPRDIPFEKIMERTIALQSTM